MVFTLKMSGLVSSKIHILMLLNPLQTLNSAQWLQKMKVFIHCGRKKESCHFHLIVSQPNPMIWESTLALKWPLLRKSTFQRKLIFMSPAYAYFENQVLSHRVHHWFICLYFLLNFFKWIFSEITSCLWHRLRKGSCKECVELHGV